MSQAIIIADASTTIQKVIKISLSEGPYFVDSCFEVTELKKSVSVGSKILVILDYDFDESQECSGLISELREINPRLNFLVLFTDRDRAKIESLTSIDGCEVLSKPFEPQDLIASCEKFEIDDDADRFSFETSEQDSEILNEAVNTRENEWKISVPGVIGESTSSIGEIPGKIDESVEENLNLEEKELDSDLEEATNPGFNFSIDDFQEDNKAPEDDSNFPVDGDLEFPEEDSPEPIVEPSQTKKPVFDSVDDLIQPTEENIVEEKQAPAKNWELSDPETFWSDDSDEDEKDLLELDNSNKAEVFFSANDTPVVETSADEIIEKIKPMLEEMIKKYCSESVDKIAWEVIPDLAENLIKTELKSIKDKTLKDS